MNHTILIIDDDPAGIRPLQTLLRSLKYRVLTAEDGTTGLKLARTQKPDLYLIDAHLSGFGADQLLKSLSSFPDLTADRVILLMEGGKTGDRRLTLGGRDLSRLKKPFPARALLAAVRKALST